MRTSTLKNPTPFTLSPILLALGLLLAPLACDDGEIAPIENNQTNNVNNVNNNVNNNNNTQCLAVAETCATPEECCSGRCEQEMCLGPTGLCFELQETCLTSSECCSGRCEATPAGALQCVVGGCVGVGGECTLAVDCCSLSCVDGTCSDEGICAVETGACDADTDCCSGGCDGTACLPSGSNCVVTGELCGDSPSCCGGLCAEVGEELRCLQVNSCRAGGELCTVGSDCCSGVCGADGLCPVMAGCQTVGEPCTGFHECCSGVCADPGTGVAVCQFNSGCRPWGEICLTEANCCSGLCAEYNSTGVWRCEKALGCMPEGEVCGMGQSTNCCPSGPDGGTQLCQETLLGVTRCFSPNSSGGCFAAEAACTFGDECCSGICLPDEQGYLVCAAGCSPLAGPCTTNGDCCDAALCVDLRCTPNVNSCIPLGAACEDSAECCSGICYASGVCVGDLD